MIVYWDTEDYSFIIENDNGKRMRITSLMLEVSPNSDSISMRDAVLIHKVDPLDTINIGDKVKPNEVAREGVVLRLIGTDCVVIYCGSQWRFPNGDTLGFTVVEAVLHSKRDDALLKIIRDRLLKF